MNLPATSRPPENPITVLQSYRGKWVYWWGLGCIDFIPKGRRRETYSIHVSGKSESELPWQEVVERARRAAARAEAKV